MNRMGGILKKHSENIEIILHENIIKIGYNNLISSTELLKIINGDSRYKITNVRELGCFIRNLKEIECIKEKSNEGIFYIFIKKRKGDTHGDK